MPVVTKIIGLNVTQVFKGTYQLCQQFKSKKSKENPRIKFEIRSCADAIKHKPILKQK